MRVRVGAGWQPGSGTGGARTPLVDAYLRLAPTLTVAILLVGLARLWILSQQAAATPGAIGIDFQAVTDAARRWVTTGQPFLGRQLQGPYPHLGWNSSDTGEFLYPPVALPAFLLFAHLPAPVWWAGCGALFVLGLVTIRPARWSWPILAGLVSLTNVPAVIIAGNPSLWISALALLGPVSGWTGALVLLKPTFAPLAVLGVWRRSWWVAVGLLIVASVAFGPLWVDWVHAVRDIQDPASELPISQLPILLVPAVAAFSGTRPGLWPSKIASLPARLRASRR